MTTPAATTSPEPDLRERILIEATRLFAQRGYAGTSVREVADRAGCTKPAVYYHFRSKERLFLEALGAQTQALTKLIEGTVGGAGKFRDRLRRGLQTFLAYVEAQPMGMRLIMVAELRAEPGQPAFEFEPVRARHQQLLRQMLEEGVAGGELRADLDLEDAGHALGGMVDQRLQMWLHGAPLAEDLADRLLDIFLRGVGA